MEKWQSRNEWVRLSADGDENATSAVGFEEVECMKFAFIGNGRNRRGMV